MAPKNLTDCPENLREAIDWLIQVRHGNGEGDNGLSNLSQALRKLIEDAIKRAFITNLDPLLKLINPSCGKSDSCNSTFESIKAVKERLSKGINVAEEHYKEVLRHIDYFTNGYKTFHYPDASRDEAFSDVSAKLKNLENLNKNLKAFTDDPNENLKSLCTGLETFLGFNSESKGYDGSGIVYSDLDRLCDAVMAFLHKIMKMISTDMNVATYYKMSPDYLQNLSNHSNTGKHGLYMTTDAIMAWYGYYDRELNNKIQSVVGEQGMLKDLEDNIATNINILQGLDTDGKFDDAVGHWYDTVTKNLSKCIKSVKLSTSDLDVPLQNKIDNEVAKIEVQIENLKHSTIRDVKHLKELGVNISGELRELERNVRGEVGQRVEAYRDALKTEFNKIKDDITLVSTTLEKHVQTLNEWIQNAEKLVTAAIPQIQAILNAIKDKDSKHHPKNIRNNAGELQRKAELLRGAVDRAKLALTPLVENIKGKVTPLEDIYKHTLKALQTTIQKQVTEAQRALQGLAGNLQNDLSTTVKVHIKKEIEKVVNALKEGISKAGDNESGSNTAYIMQEFDIGLNRDDVPMLKSWAGKARVGKLAGSLATLGRKSSTNDLQPFKEFLKQFPGLAEDFGDKQKTFFDCLTEDLEKKLQGAIRDIKSNLGKHMLNYHGHARTGGTIDKAIENVKSDVDGYFDGPKGAGEISRAKLNERQYDMHNGNLVTEIEKIKSQGLEPFNQFESPGTSDHIDRNTFAALKSAITENLQNLIEEIDRNANDSKGVLQKLNNLKDTYFNRSDVAHNSIYKIKKDLDTLQKSTLGALIEKARTFLKTTLPSHASKCIDAIHKYLNKHVTQTIKNVKKDALDRYVASRIAELQSLQTFVEKQRGVVYSIIRIDCNTGVKGLLKELITQIDGKTLHVNNQTKLGDMAVKVRTFLVNIWDYIGRQLTGNNNLLNAFVDVKIKKMTLLDEIQNSGHFTHSLTFNLGNLISAVDSLVPTDFAGTCNTLLDIFKSGLRGFHEELSRAYISVYSKAFRYFDWDTAKTERCAKICFTVITTFFEQLHYLFLECSKDWRHLSVDGIAKATEKKDELKLYLQGQGYDILNLINKNNSGENIVGFLMKAFNDKNEFETVASSSNYSDFETYVLFIRKSKGPLSSLYRHLASYYKVCHLSIHESRRYPCSVRDMLSWLCGLPYTTVYTKVKTYCEASLADKKNSDDETLMYILRYTLLNNLPSACQLSYNVLISIQGHGRGSTQADYPYACNFLDNSRGFHYPSNVKELIDMIKEICTRLLSQLYFVYSRCRTSSKYYGWYNCSYGRNVQGHQWDCDKSSLSDNNSRPKSPLQSFLMDGLIGFLPHKLTSVGCKSECSTCPTTSPGQRCVTPMGFWDLTDAATITRNGGGLHNVLARFCKNAESPLCALLRSCICILPHPPKNISDMFALYSNVMQRWNGPHYGHNSKYKKKIDDAITKSLPLPEALHGYYDGSQLTDKIKDLFCSDDDHTDQPNDNNHCGLQSLSTTPTSATYKQCSGKYSSCAPYLQPLGLHAHHTFAEKHASLYLSWCSYLAWDFWALLECLLNAFKHISCKSSGCSSCDCASGKHGISDPPPSDAAITPKPGCHCKSIVDCKGVLSTFFQYGFTFRVPKELCESGTRKTCGDFVKQLSKVLYKGYYKGLFEEIDNFIFAIRTPFYYTLVALWAYSLFYLLYVLIGRLDLLHIKSHLHSPSSHRIAAQSLLAAGRVKALNKVLYLQP